MKHLLLAITALGMVSAPAYAAPCRGAKGKFIKCPEKAAAKPATKCRDAKGHFAKCPAK